MNVSPRNHGGSILCIRDIVLKTIGLVDVLRPALWKRNVQIAFVFGSMARDQETAGSDLDLMVIGKVGLRKLTSLLSGLSEQIGREINPHVMTRVDYRKRLKSKHHFVMHVLEATSCS